jgi:glycosyltransferase involved in cell wall biosynthesis
LTERQEQLIRESFRARERDAHRFVCFDRIDPMKGTHTLIAGIKLFLDEARAREGESYKQRYHFSCIHQLLDFEWYAEMNPKHQYVRLCKQQYAALQAEHPGVINLSESLTAQAGNRDMLPRLIHGASVLALLGQDGLGLSALEGAYINRDQDTGLIIGDQSGSFLEAERRGFGGLVFGVEAGNPIAIQEALEKTVALRERASGTLANQNKAFAEKFVIPRQDSMMLE